ncbi:MAG TPA: ribbon-helix-helix domain-containing protein [Phycisphaerae bacterium]|nr:ribbon-helix-helix domain-containing protein [Phycisphaerae bacterium]
MRTRDPLLAVRLPQALLDLLDEEVRQRPSDKQAYRDAASRSAVVRDALAAYLGRKMDGMHRLAPPRS